MDRESSMKDDGRAEGVELDRRAFLKTAAAVAGTVAVGGNATSAGQVDPGLSKEVDAFLSAYVERWLPLDTKASEAAWAAATDVTEAHTAAQVAAGQAVNEVAGSPRVIAQVTRFLAQKDKLDEIQARQLEKIRLRAAESPGTLPEVVKARTEAEAKQSAAQDGFTFTVKKADGAVENPSANRIDQVLINSKDLDERKLYWAASKEIGGPLREGVLRLRDLRNQVAQKLGFDDFFALQVADYGMTVPEMIGALRFHRRRGQAVIFPSSHMGEAHAGPAVRRRRPQGGDPRALAAQPMGPELAGAGRGGRHGRPVQRAARASSFPSRPSGSTRRWASTSCRPASGPSRTCTRPTPSRAARRTATPAPGTSTSATTSAA